MDHQDNGKTADIWWRYALLNLKRINNSKDRSSDEWFTMSLSLNALSLEPETSPLRELLGTTSPALWSVKSYDTNKYPGLRAKALKTIERVVITCLDAAFQCGKALNAYDGCGKSPLWDPNRENRIDHMVNTINMFLDDAIVALDLMHSRTRTPEMQIDLSRFEVDAPSNEELPRHPSFYSYLRSIAEMPVNNGILSSNINALTGHRAIPQ